MSSEPSQHASHSLLDIRLRDPFVLAVPEERQYYLYGSTDPNTWSGPGTGFEAYRSTDLERWDGPFRVFTPPNDFWGTENFWAPEVFEIEGRFFMLATFRGSTGRGTAILVGETPLGPFIPHSDGAVTPTGWDALDGTLFVDESGEPWVIFCHEWHQSIDGTVCGRRLSPDLRVGVGEASLLFSASQAPWSLPIKDDFFVSDGPFLHRCRDGSLRMIWSSFGAFGYAQGIATSSTGKLSGPWIQDQRPIWEADGGHGMLFRGFDGELRLTFHHPNQTPYERAILLAVEDGRRGLRLKSRMSPLAIVARRFNRGGSRRQKLRFALDFALRGFNR